MRVIFQSVFAFLVILSTVKPIPAQPVNELGVWGDVFDLKVIPIHAMLLPSSEILMYGTNDEGKQGGALYYEVWDIRSGNYGDESTHELLTHSTSVDIFCTVTSIDVSTGNFLVIGGDNDDNYGVNDVLEFDTKTLELRPHPKGNMIHPRWYGTSANLPDGSILVVGGRGAESNWESAICELWTSSDGFRELPGTEVPAMVNKRGGSWWYPVVAVNSNGEIILFVVEGEDTPVYLVGVAGEGSIEEVARRPFEMDKLGPVLMFDINKLVFLATDGTLWVADISDSRNIVFTEKNNLGSTRSNAGMNVLPHGHVIITGGCSSADDNGNDEDLAVKDVQIWDPTTDTVYDGPKEEIARLYHATSLILPDGSIYSGGGGAPGPLTNLNGNIYKPGYFFDPYTGGEATRPTILSWPQNVMPGETFSLQVGNANFVSRVTMTKPGSMTHSRNCDHRWVELPFVVVDANRISVQTPGSNVLIPGLWMVNTISSDGFPSEGHLLGVNMTAATNIYVPPEIKSHWDRAREFFSYFSG